MTEIVKTSDNIIGHRCERTVAKGDKNQKGNNLNIKTIDRIYPPAYDQNLTRRQFIERVSAAGLALSGLGLFGCDVGDIISPDRTPIESDGVVPALIIGSGFGGAVTALRLGQAGIRTMVIEQGKRWSITPNSFSPNFPPDGRSTWLRTQTILPFGPSLPINRHTGVLDRVDYENMQVYRGTAVGGGSIVYGGITVQPPESLFYEIFPRGISYQELEPYYDRVRHMLRITPVPADVEAHPYYDYARVSVEHGANAGLEVQSVGQATDWDVIRSEIAGTVSRSYIIGEQVYGNRSGVKNSLDQNYLPMAEATGYVTIHPLHRVIDIAQQSSENYRVTVEEIDETGRVLQTKEITTTYLFLAAGSVGTTELLVKARELGNLPNLNEEVGQGWGTNGNAMFMRSVNELTGRMQAGPIIKMILDYNNAASPSSVEPGFFPIGQECGCLLYLLIALDTERGSFSYDSATNKVELMWPGSGSDQAASAALDFVERINAANGGLLGTPAGLLFELPDVLKNLTYHPLGGVVMGKACDLNGRVHGYPKMYVMDGSTLPGSCATANPSLTIAALAERNIETILAEDFAATGS